MVVVFRVPGQDSKKAMPSKLKIYFTLFANWRMQFGRLIKSKDSGYLSPCPLLRSFPPLPALQ